MKRLLIDLTDIESWQGHHGGTQRVVYGIAKQFFLQTDKDYHVEFMVFSGRGGSFYQTGFEPIYERTESQQAILPDAHAQAANAISLKQRIKLSVRTYVPESVRKNKHVRTSAKHALRLSKTVARKAKQQLKNVPSLQSSTHGPEVYFTKDDVVLILGKPWDSPNMERALTSAKAEKGFMLAQVIYDLIIPLYPQLHHPSLFKSYTQYVFEAIYASDLLLPISKSSEKDLKIFAKSLNLEMPKTKVIRLADEITGQEGSCIKPDGRIAETFIACIGTVEIRKNHSLLYYAYKLAEQQGIELPQLVIVGSRGWLAGDFQYLVEHDPNVKDKIIILDNVNDQGLGWIYAKCKFSVYPSFYEGWGLPVAEALASGKVSIASNASSIPEIAGDMIDYFTPYDAQQCLDCIVKYLDPTTLKQKEAQIKQAYKQTNWSGTAGQVVEGIRSLQNQPPNYL